MRHHNRGEANPDPETMHERTCFCKGRIHPEGAGREWHIIITSEHDARIASEKAK